MDEEDAFRSPSSPSESESLALPVSVRIGETDTFWEELSAGALELEASDPEEAADDEFWNGCWVRRVADSEPFPGLDWTCSQHSLHAR